MKKQINPTIKAHLLRGAFYLLLLVAVCAIPFALAERNAAKRSVANPNPPASNLPQVQSLDGTVPAGAAQAQLASAPSNPDVAPPSALSAPKIPVGIAAKRLLVPMFPGACPPGAWSTAVTGPATRYRAGGTTDGTYVYVYGGSNAAAQYLNDLWRWNPATQTWTQLANMPTGKSNTQGAYWNGKIYVPGGYIGSHITENAIYDIASNTWTTGAPLPAAQSGQQVAFNNKIYNFGGNPGPQSTVTIYDIAANTWTTGASMPVALTYGRATATCQYAYYAGGIAGTSTVGTVYRYDFAANTWATMAPLQQIRTSEELMTSPDKTQLYAVMGGGANGTDYFVGVPLANSVEIYDIASNTWSYGNPVVTKAAAPSGGLAGGKAMVQGGVDNTTYYDAVQVSTLPCGVVPCGGTPTPTPTATRTPTPTPTVGGTATPTPTPTCGGPAAWQSGPAQPPARYAFQAALGTDNMLYIAGGQTADPTPILYNQVSRYNYTTNTWSNVATLPVALGQAAIGAWNGKIYVAGGFIGGTSVTNALRIYDIATNTWTSGANMPTSPGVEAAAGAVVNGKFYVMGGDDFNNGLNTNFIYDIATNTWSTGATLPDNRTNTYGTAYNGLIYVYGGVILPAFTTVDTLLRYDPVANSWTSLGSAGTGGRGNYGGISPFGTGQLLITDGADASGASTTATHIFTISGGTFSAGPALIGNRAGHAQGTLPDGRVLVADGFNTSTTTVSTVELLTTPPCPSATPTPTATAAGTATPTATRTPTPTPTVGGTATPTPTATAPPPTATPTATPAGTPRVTPTARPRPTPAPRP